MSITTPASKNFLSPLGFRFVLKRAPNLSFNVQSIGLPGLTLSEASTPTPFISIPQASHLTYSPLSVTFRVQEGMADYLEIYNWMNGLGAPVSFDQYKNLKDKADGSGEGVYSDISLVILDSSMNSNINVYFYDAFPIDLSDLRFTTMDTDVNYIECTVDFRFLRYTIEPA